MSLVVGYLHFGCGAQLKLEDRTVVPNPKDKGYPEYITLTLPYCPKCETVVDVTAVTPVIA